MEKFAEFSHITFILVLDSADKCGIHAIPRPSGNAALNLPRGGYKQYTVDVDSEKDFSVQFLLNESNPSTLKCPPLYVLPSNKIQQNMY